MENITEKGLTIMAIIKILYRTIILLIISVIQVICVLVEGLARLISKIGDYLWMFCDILMRQFEKRKAKIKAKNIDVPL